jgi:hypothetical protein
MAMAESVKIQGIQSMNVEGIEFRATGKNDRVELNAEQLRASADPDLRAAADADRDGNGWVTAAEVDEGSWFHPGNWLRGGDWSPETRAKVRRLTGAAEWALMLID